MSGLRRVIRNRRRRARRLLGSLDRRLQPILDDCLDGVVAGEIGMKEALRTASQRMVVSLLTATPSPFSQSFVDMYLQPLECY